MTGFKATYNMKCMGMEYEVGKTYELEGKLKICHNGFHFCQKLEDVFRYYNIFCDVVVLKVEILGKVIHEANKSATDKLKILEVIPNEDWKDIAAKIIDTHNEMLTKFDDLFKTATDVMELRIKWREEFNTVRHIPFLYDAAKNAGCEILRKYPEMSKKIKNLVLYELDSNG